MTTKDFLDAVESLLYHVTLLERRGDEIRDLRWHRQELEVVCALLYERLRTGEPSLGIRRRAALATRAVLELVDDHRSRTPWTYERIGLIKMCAADILGPATTSRSRSQRSSPSPGGS